MIQKISRKVFLYSVFAFAVFTIAIPYKASSGPAYDGLFEIKQPSGHTFKAKKRGDEWHHWVETEDGYGIYKSRKTNCWEYYLPSDDHDKPKLGIEGAENNRAIVGDTDPVLRNIPKRLRPAKIKKPESLIEKTEMYRQEKSQKVFKRKSESTAVSGVMNLLVIGVQYEDHSATYSADEIQPLLFGESSSIADYFNDVSFGAVTIEPASESHGTSNDGFIGWLQLSGNHPNTGSTDYQTAENAIIAADDYIDFASYDADGDGYVESTELAVLIIVAGYAAEYGDGDHEPSVWGHTHLGVVATIEGKNIDGYSMVGEKHEDHLGTFGTMVHELGHLIFDLPDLYDTDTDNGDSYGIGYFGLMSHGGWGAKYGETAGSSPTHPCAWSKEYLSWGTVDTITSGQTISLPKADGNSSSMFRLDTSDPDQYFLIENRQFSGYDIGFQRWTGSSGHGGIVIYHIDTSKTDMWPGSTDVNADEDDKGVDVEEANEGSVGYSMLDTYEKAAHTNMFYFPGNNDSFSNSTTPNSRLKNNNSTYISITSISSYGDTMSAYATRPPTATTGSVTNLESDSATLNGTVNPYGEETTVWFEYGATSGSYSNTTSTQNVSGSGETSVSSDISGLTEGITYYYRIVAQNGIGTVYGNEDSFISSAITPMLAGGDDHSIALDSSGIVWAWGDNEFGQLGDNSNTDSLTPLQVSSLYNIIAISAGMDHTIALKSDGTVWTWGDNNSGRLGDGTFYDKNSPVQAINISNITAIAGGGYHTITLKSDGTVWTWGYNGYGQLGNSSTTSSASAVQVNGLSDVITIAGGGYHTIALKSDSTVWAWGSNSLGQLGDGSTSNSSVPVKVDNLTDIAAIAGGFYHSIALKSDGTVWAWGSNVSGQLGDGSTTNSSTPVLVSGISGITDVAGCQSHTIALKSDGTVWSWGGNWNGELGNGSTTRSLIPVQVSNLTGITAIAGGVSHGLALKSDGTVWAWGDNWDGQLGDGTTEDQDTPVQVDNINLGASPDTFAPSGTIQINSGDDYVNSTSVSLNLSATDDMGVTGYYLSTSLETPVASDPSWTSVSSTASYSESVSHTLSSGDGSKTVYVWYKDDAGNISDSASDSITLDTTAPTVSITSPTSDATYSTTNSTINLSGSASDSTSGVSSVAWSNTTTGSSGTASGTTSWSVSGIKLSSGNNTVTITATDNAGNASTDTLTVAFSAPTPTPTPATTKAPAVTTGSATNVTSGSATLNGTVNANGLSTTAWFEYGKTSGSYSNTSSTQSVNGSNDTSLSIGISGLSAGTKYYYKLVAKNSSGTSYGSENTFTTTSVSATPTPTPTVTTATLIVQVTDVDDNPVEGATVTVDGASGVTDSDGTATFTLETGDYTVTVSKEGYDTSTVEATVTASVTIQAVKLSLSTCPDSATATATTASASPDELEIEKGDSEDVVITVTDENGCPAEGVTVIRKLSTKNKKKIKVTPVSVITDENGEAVFAIRAKKSSGKASVKFSVSGVNDKLKVTVNLTD